MDRRKFILAGSGALLLYPILSHQVFNVSLLGNLLPNGNQKKKLLIGGFRNGPQPKIDKLRRVTEKASGSVKILDLENLSQTKIETNFVVHSICQNPKSANMIASVSKWSTEGGIFDIKTLTLTNSLVAPPDMWFFGHALFSNSGDFLYASATKGDSYEGFLLKINPLNGEVVDQMSTGGRAPHEFIFLDNDSVLIANSGYDPLVSSATANLALLNLNSRKIENTFPAPNPAHLLRRNDSEVLVGSGTPGSPNGNLYTVNLSNKNIRFMNMSHSYELAFAKGEKLSLTSINDNLMAATTSVGKMILFWDLKANQITSKVFQASINGIITRDHDLLVSTEGGSLFSINIGDRGSLIGSVTPIVEKFSNAKHLKYFEV